MALPSSGQLTFEQIGTELGISTSSPQSLRAMSATAGKGVPDSVEEFYGYSHSNPPLPPTNVVATWVEVKEWITIAWEDNSGDEDNFRLEVSVSGQGYEHITDPNANVIKYIWQPEEVDPSGYSYRFRIRSENTNGDSAWAYSNTVIIPF